MSTTATNEPQVQTFATGAKRGTDHADCDLALIPPEAIRAYGRAFAEGRKKYGTHNWLKGFPQLGVINHALQHIYSYLEGDRSEDHLGHAIWNIGTAIHQEKHRPDLLDLPPYAEMSITEVELNATDDQTRNLLKSIDGWQHEASRQKERYERANAELCALRAAVNKDFWHWQGDGHDHPESLACHVVMTSEQLRELLNKKADSKNVDLPCNPVQPPRQANPPSTIRASQPDRRTTDAIRVDDILADQSHASDCDGGGFAARV